MQVVESKDTWNGMPVLQFDFLMTKDASPKELGCGNVRVLVSARKNWHLISGCGQNEMQGWLQMPTAGWSRSLDNRSGSPMCGEESVAFHRRMKLGLVSKFEMDPVFKMPQRGASFRM